MRSIILCVVFTCPSVQYFSMKKKMKLWILIYVLFYSLEILTETFPILSPVEPYIINVHISTCKVPIILVECKLNFKFLDLFLKHYPIRNFMKTRRVGTEFYVDWQTEKQTDWQTDRLTDWLTNWQTDRLTDWLTDKQTDRQTDGQPETEKWIVAFFEILLTFQ
jgi:hypothetical protein